MDNKQHPRIFVIGAGPTGLGASWRLTERGHTNWMLIDAAATPGGLASSVIDDHGFTWDHGVHVLFSLPGGWIQHRRESTVWVHEKWVPYPLQNNLHKLGMRDRLKCGLDLLLARARRHGGSVSANFHEWILSNFGRHLAEIFMLPYNRKVWAIDPVNMGTGWMGERVSTVGLAPLLRNLVFHKDHRDWGPNAYFRYPQRGGTGAIWQALFDRLPQSHIRMGTQVLRIATKEREVTFSDGRTDHYDSLISTMPLDHLLTLISDRPDLSKLAESLRYASTYLLGIGVRGMLPEFLKQMNWIYFPQEQFPFHRVSLLSNFAPSNVPGPEPSWSLLCEVNAPPERPVTFDTLTEKIKSCLRQCGILKDEEQIQSLWQKKLDHGYPIPFVGRDQRLQELDASLRQANIWSRGRFGGWKYEVSNQDHSLMQGVEAANHICSGDFEATYHDPARVNSRTRKAKN